MSELNIEVDENNKVLGLKPREEFYGGNIIHRSSYLLLFNSKSELLLIKRSDNKRWYPGLYTFTVSGTVADESYSECIRRETLEEIGLKDLSFHELFTFRHKDSQDNAFGTIFWTKSDELIKPDQHEISGVRWVVLAQLRDDMTNKPNNYAHPFHVRMANYWKQFGTNLPL